MATFALAGSVAGPVGVAIGTVVGILSFVLLDLIKYGDEKQVVKSLKKRVRFPFSSSIIPLLIEPMPRMVITMEFKELTSELFKMMCHLYLIVSFQFYLRATIYLLLEDADLQSDLLYNAC